MIKITIEIEEKQPGYVEIGYSGNTTSILSPLMEMEMAEKMARHLHAFDQGEGLERRQITPFVTRMRKVGNG